MRAIKAGIFTAATKSELEKLEAERTRWTQLLQDRSVKVAAMFPRAADRYPELMSELASLSDKTGRKRGNRSGPGGGNLAGADGGRLPRSGAKWAVRRPGFACVWGKVKKCGCGDSICAAFGAPLRIALK